MVVWTLKRGALDEPEAVGPLTQKRLEREAFLATLERDPPMTVEQMWREQGEALGSYKRHRPDWDLENVTVGSVLRLHRGRIA